MQDLRGRPRPAVDDRADGNGNDQVFAAARPDLFEVPPGLAALGREVPLEAEFDAGSKVGWPPNRLVAAVAAVASGGAAFGDVLFAPPRHQAVAAVAGRHVDGRFVDELHSTALFPAGKTKWPVAGPTRFNAFAVVPYAGRRAATCTCLRLRCVANSTVAVDQREQGVESFPEADVLAGIKFVPR